ncbi:TVP38/TMEM64 family protein [Streptococcus loxodontisalivarius]|uniref:TVP38/TMEM64 family membrane protein n=1 Tax=Streptococcus loxodontisalivarius TaxID=1349415 RepID=A0ABS2PRL6_9STRE|nr:TVP38/TMEM64 family protein [Streptococcus loxodontisalivarius]MBM7642355.1 putative membrane protein YdjX (TVP38/TMEM64 family) [Streptococcus loxodontisalivarius]
MKVKTIDQKLIIRSLTILGLFASAFLLYYFKTHPNMMAVGGSFQKTLVSLGAFGPLLFILLQMVQVIYPIIPGGMTAIIGHIIFGPLYGFIYNFVGIFIGSLLAFGLARRYGNGFAKAFVSEETYDKYVSYLDRNDGKFFEKFLAAAFILPGFPDDFLCVVAGLSKMTWKKFIVIFLISKPATLYLYTIIGYQGLNAVLQIFQ